MLGRKQSLKGEPVLADYGPEESLNESADIEWVNKVVLVKKQSLIIQTITAAVVLVSSFAPFFIHVPIFPSQKFCFVVQCLSSCSVITTIVRY